MKLSPLAQFNALAAFVGFESTDIDAIRGSVNHLLREINELIRSVDQALTSESSGFVIGDFSPAQKEKMQSLFASFIMRTINCNFDQDYCDFAVEVSSGEDVPQNLFSMGLCLAMNYVARTLPSSIEDADQLKDMLAAWNKLTCILRELTRKDK